MRILQVIYDYDVFFLQRQDYTRSLGCLQFKLHMLENGTWANAIDEYHWIAKNATMECMKWFMHVVVVIFQSRYLWEPIKTCIENQLKINVEKDFACMLGSLDYIHYRWKNCLVRWWQGQFQNKDGERLKILEAIVD